MPSALPVSAARASAVLREVTGRPHVSISEIPAPGKLAPYALALGAEVRAEVRAIMNWWLARGIASGDPEDKTPRDG